MDADELDVRARLRRHVRGLIDQLLTLGYTRAQLAGRTILELDELRHQALRQLMKAPAPPAVRDERGVFVPAHRRAEESDGQNLPRLPSPGPDESL